MRIEGMKIGHLKAACAIAALSLSLQASAHQRYQVLVLPPDGGPDSFLAGYDIPFAPLNWRGTVGVVGDTAAALNEPVNAYTFTDGRLIRLQPAPAVPNYMDTYSYINWLNQGGVSAGWIRRTKNSTTDTADNAVIWLPDGKIVDIQPPNATQSHAVWINDFGQVSGWAQNAIADSCSFGNGAETRGFVWQFGVLRPLGTLGGTQSYGEFINDRGQVSGHSETSSAVDPNTGCPPYDPFIWEHGKMTDINPGNFGGGVGGTNFLNNEGQAVGFGTTSGDVGAEPFLWQHGKLTNLNTIGNLGGSGSGFNVNDRGHVVGIEFPADGSAEHAVLWRDGTFTDLMALSGYDCSTPFRINNRDQIVGYSFSCETGASSAFIWEDGEMVDLNALIPADSGVQLQYAGWINDDGVIAAQAVMTGGASSGDSRAVLLIPAGACDPEELRAAITALSATSGSKVLTIGTNAKPAILSTRDGRINPKWLRPSTPAQLHRSTLLRSD